MSKIPVLLNGLPGQVATMLVPHLLKNEKLKLLPFSFSGPEITEKSIDIEGLFFELIKKEEDKDKKISEELLKNPDLIVIDYTHPSAVNLNADFYIRHKLPFVMGTTGGDREALFNSVKNSEISAVIAPNMAKQIVAFQAMMEFAAENFPGLFKNYSLSIEESHQAGKADTSGTAKAMVTYFNALGIPFDLEEIKKERDPEKQEKEWEIPKEYIKGHAWHRYELISEDKNSSFTFKHNINGRDIYAQGTIDAVFFLVKALKKDAKGRVYSMIDVLKNP